MDFSSSALIKVEIELNTTGLPTEKINHVNNFNVLPCLNATFFCVNFWFRERDSSLSSKLTMATASQEVRFE